MSRKTPNLEPLSSEQMKAEQMEKQNSRIYKIEADEHRGSELSQLTARIRDELSGEIEKIQLVNGDIQKVKHQVLLYFDACTETGTLPSIIGLSRALGYSRAGLYKYLETYHGTPIAEYLEIVRHGISDALDSASLYNNVNSIVAIFIQKSIHQRIDRAELVVSQPTNDNPLGALIDEEELRRRYLGAVPED